MFSRLLVKCRRPFAGGELSRQRESMACRHDHEETAGGGGDGHDHSHGHSHEHSHDQEDPDGMSLFGLIDTSR